MRFFDDENLSCILAVIGIGPLLAHKQTMTALDLFEHVSEVFVVGFAGGLVPSSQRGDLVIAKDIGKLRGQEIKHSRSFFVGFAEHQSTWTRLVSSPEVISDPIDKASIYSATGFESVDMEAWQVLECCEKKNISCSIVRVILDAGSQTLPDFSDMISEFGQPKIGALLRTIWKHPQTVRDLWEMRPSVLMPLAQKYTHVIEEYIDKYYLKNER
ncbi:MAG: hypothetical protein KDD52_02635 [Bdellovibrionales bacterium]|nr:hypothetical protein [Bdellovibrionales bacterium]